MPEHFSKKSSTSRTGFKPFSGKSPKPHFEKTARSDAPRAAFKKAGEKTQAGFQTEKKSFGKSAHFSEGRGRDRREGGRFEERAQGRGVERTRPTSAQRGFVSARGFEGGRGKQAKSGRSFERRPASDRASRRDFERSDRRERGDAFAGAAFRGGRERGAERNRDFERKDFERAGSERKGFARTDGFSAPSADRHRVRRDGFEPRSKSQTPPRHFERSAERRIDAAAERGAGLGDNLGSKRRLSSSGGKGGFGQERGAGQRGFKGEGASRGKGGFKDGFSRKGTGTGDFGAGRPPRRAPKPAVREGEFLGSGGIRSYHAPSRLGGKAAPIRVIRAETALSHEQHERAERRERPSRRERSAAHAHDSTRHAVVSIEDAQVPDMKEFVAQNATAPAPIAASDEPLFLQPAPEAPHTHWDEQQG